MMNSSTFAFDAVDFKENLLVELADEGIHGVPWFVDWLVEDTKKAMVAIGDGRMQVVRMAKVTPTQADLDSISAIFSEPKEIMFPARRRRLIARSSNRP